MTLFRIRNFYTLRCHLNWFRKLSDYYQKSYRTENKKIRIPNKVNFGVFLSTLKNPALFNFLFHSALFINNLAFIQILFEVDTFTRSGRKDIFRLPNDKSWMTNLENRIPNTESRIPNCSECTFTLQLFFQKIKTRTDQDKIVSNSR